MTPQKTDLSEITFDPDNWKSIRQLGHRMVDDIIEYLENLKENPVWQPTPPEIKEKLNQPLPERSEGPEKAYHDFLDFILPYAKGNKSSALLGLG